ncbi:hypothetical protein GALMADRAFT_68525 [Galerina marginata CBS 339.88]|uniref:Phosphoribulokinase/uridine kinase domain-containing protein n=1 Tax=Galerina marginata (strain CBS 339.88) TaxID=685588 RepID=A0A067SXL7_GALM3|nr:hypothetical protein GALMADRAFT_68525 [Galerina marginata CBS 339.88]
MSSLELVAQYVLEKLQEKRPLFVAIQGPQGSGKSFLSSRLQSYLEATPHTLRVAVLSIDDLYLPHDDLVSLAASNPENFLWQGRGQPGTHDVDLGVQILSALKAGNNVVELPRFEKSLFEGEGDRLPIDGSGPVVTQPPTLDVVILEGWCVGFQPISDEELLSRWNGVWKLERERLGLGEVQMGRLVDVQAINDKLHLYLRLWDFFDVLIQAEPPTASGLSQYAVVYKWRMEQEHNMKARNGGRGMSDNAVKSFVDRYIPGYVFFGGFPILVANRDHSPTSSSRAMNGMTLILDEARQVTGATLF